MQSDDLRKGIPATERGADALEPVDLVVAGVRCAVIDSDPEAVRQPVVEFLRTQVRS